MKRKYFSSLIIKADDNDDARAVTEDFLELENCHDIDCYEINDLAAAAEIAENELHNIRQYEACLQRYFKMLYDKDKADKNCDKDIVSARLAVLSSIIAEDWYIGCPLFNTVTNNYAIPDDKTDLYLVNVVYEY